MSIEIIDIPELVGRTILKATRWSDDSGISIVLDNGGILQIDATFMSDQWDDNNPPEAIVRWQVEFSPVKQEDE